MPIYDFKCEHCGYEFEKLVYSSLTEPRCPECRLLVTQKLPSAPGHFDLKGGGYYKTDFKNK